MEGKDIMIQGLLILFLLYKYSTVTEAAPSVKRQGMFGLCQGWGAGCALDYRGSQKSSKTNFPGGSARSGNSPMNYVPNYLFTSGNSWDPIGKRSAYFTDIPYLGNPFLSMPRFRRPPSKNDLTRRYPLAYQSTYETRSQERNVMDE